MRDAGPVPQPRQLSRRAFLLLAASLTLLALLITLRPTLDGIPLNSHEALVAQSAREITDTGGTWLVPTFNDQPRLKKPPLMNWAVALVALTIPGAADVPPWAARLPAVLAGAALVALTIALGAVVYDRRAGLLAGLLALTTLGFFTSVNSARPEMLYAASCALLLLGFAGAFTSADRSRRQLGWALAAWLGFALAFLAKGPHIPLILTLGVALALALERRPRRIRHVVRPLTGLAIILLIPGAWILAALLTHPDAADVWYHQLFLYANDEDAPGPALLEHLSPFYLVAVPFILLPWVVPLIFGLFVTFETGRPDLRRGRILLWTIALTILIMTLHAHRRDYYMLPLIPPLAVLMARGTIDAIEKHSRHPRARPAIRALAILHAIAALATVVILAAAIAPDPPIIVGAVVGAILSAGAIVAIVRTPLRPATLIAAPAAVWLVMPATSDSIAWWRQRRFELWRFTEHAATLIPPDEPVYSVGGFESLLVYSLDRPVTELVTLDKVPPPPPGSRAWIITEPDELERPTPNLRLQTIDQMSERGSSPNERLLLLAATRPPDAQTSKATDQNPTR